MFAIEKQAPPSFRTPSILAAYGGSIEYDMLVKYGSTDSYFLTISQQIVTKQLKKAFFSAKKCWFCV